MSVGKREAAARVIQYHLAIDLDLNPEQRPAILAHVDDSFGRNVPGTSEVVVPKALRFGLGQVT